MKLSSGNIYKWEAGHIPNSPKAKKILEGFVKNGIDLDEVIVKPAVKKDPPVCEYKEKYYSLLEKYNSLLESIVKK